MLEIRPISEDEMETFRLTYKRNFGSDIETDPEALRRFLLLNPVETAIAAFDRGRMVGTLSAYDLKLSVPGAAVIEMAGVSHVTVHPTHRRRGILRQMMEQHLRQAHERGHVTSGLWASEEPIYGRYGFGPATWMIDLHASAGSLDSSSEVGEADQSVSLLPAEADEARTVLPEVYESLQTAVAGRIGRSSDWWNERFFERLSDSGKPKPAPRVAVARRGETPVGYLMYLVVEPPGPGKEGTTKVVELLAADDRVRHRLWSLAATVDLYRNVHHWGMPEDDPVLIETSRFRQPAAHREDGLWLRLLDVPRALNERRYERDGVVSMSVVDEMIGSDGRISRGPAEGRYLLEVEGGIGQCQNVADAAVAGESAGRLEVRLSVATLGRLYLGAHEAWRLHRAGLIEGSTEAVASLSDLLATRRAPHCPEVF